MKIKIILALLLTGTVTVTIGASYFSYQALKRNNQELVDQNTELNILNTKQENTIKVNEKLLRDVRDSRALIQEVKNSTLVSDKELNKKLNQTKTGGKRDLDSMLSKHPELMQNIINKGTRNIMDCLQDETCNELNQGKL